MIKVRFPLFLWFLLMTVHVLPQDQTRDDSLKRLLRKAKIDTIKVDLLNQLFEENVNSDSSIARDYADQAYRLSRKSQYNKGIADYYLKLAKLNIAQDNFRQARNNIQQFIDMKEDMGDLKAVAGGYYAMGFCLRNLQDDDAQLQTCQGRPGLR